MKMTNKLGLMTGLLAGTLALNGCMTEQEHIIAIREYNAQKARESELRAQQIQASNSQGTQENGFNRFMNGMTDAFFSGGGLFYAAGNSATQQGNFQRANAYNTLGRIQEQNYNRETQIQAAREGRSEVNVYINQNNPVEVAGTSRYSRGRTYYSFAFNNWRDLNGDKVASVDEFEGVSDTYSLSGRQNIVFQSRIRSGLNGYYTKLWITGPSGQLLFAKVGQQLTGDLACVEVNPRELADFGIGGQCEVIFELLNPDMSRFDGRTFDKYKINFVP